MFVFLWINKHRTVITPSSINASFTIAIVALILVGAGLAGGFPIMFGIVGQLYSQISGTAFSFILVIALIGNIMVNYGMGMVAQHYGVQQVVNVALIELAVMTVLCFFIQRNTNTKLSVKECRAHKRYQEIQ